MRAGRKKRPRGAELLPAEGALRIRWSDGSASHYDLAALRRACPCALCREAREKSSASSDVLPVLGEEALAATAEARRVDFVGRYGLRIEWADGHDHGIYTFDFFRQLAL